MIVDAHHHFWRYDPVEYDWIDDSMHVIRRDFLPEELEAELTRSEVDGVVSVQARQCVEETHWLLSLAESHAFMWGVIGWVPLRDPGVGELLDSFASNRALKGMRHVVQGEPAGFLEDPDFQRGIQELTRRNLCYDLLILDHQLEEAIRFVDRHPEQSFVLDHVAKPRIRDGEISGWQQGIRALAERSHVTCKISGMVTEADPSNWTPDQLQPYLEIVLEAFGPERLMLGTDWPVCLVGTGYSDWVSLIRRFASALSTAEQDALLGGTACRTYHLSTPATDS